MASSRRARAALVLSLALGATVMTAGASAAPSSGAGGAWGDITATARGGAAIERATGLFRAAGVPTAAGDVRVLEVGADRVVVPRWVRVEHLRATNVPRGDRIAKAVEAAIVVGLRGGQRTAGLDGQLAAAGGAIAAAPYWSQYDSGCFAWLRNGGSYMAPCYYVSKLINDGSTTRDYFALRQKASIGTDRWGSANFDGWLMSVRTAGSPAQSWQEWEPAGEIRGDCGSVTLSVMVKGVSIGVSSTACERWEPTLWEDAGHFRNKWNCDCWLGVAGMRQVASNIAVSVAQGKYPNWTLSAGFLGW